MESYRILLVEHELVTAAAIKAHLSPRKHLCVEVTSTGQEALKHVLTSSLDAVVLDVRLPDMPGLLVCRVVKSRERTAHLPLIVLADRNTVGPGPVFEVGADDYLGLPVDLDELEARLMAALHRRPSRPPLDEPEHFEGAFVRADFDNVSVTVSGRPVLLTKREFLLLRLFVRHQNQVLSRNDLLAGVWGTNRVSERIVDSAIWKLRTKLREAGRQIQTLNGFGYRFNEPPQLRDRRSS